MRAEDKPLQAPSLLELSANAVAKDDTRLLYEKCSRDPSSSCPAANIVVELPMTVADVVVKHVCRNLRNESANAHSVAENLRPFLDGERQPLGRLDLSGLNITDRTFALLLAAQQSTLKSLDLSHIRFTPQSLFSTTSEKVCSFLTDLKVTSLKLDSLKVTSCDLLRIPRFRSREVHESQKTNLELTEPLRHFVEFCPNIQHLYLQQGLLNNIKDETADEFLFRIFKALEGLKTLDLSEWNFPNHLLILEKVPNLTTLILYDVRNLESCIPMLSGLKNLRCLDLSQSDRVTGQYSKPVICLHTLVTELPNLEWLDISGTNLTSAVSDDDRPHNVIDFASSYIAGLSFLSRPLKYLGIFNCDIESHFENIPAEKICCDHSEDQIILAMEAYMSRPKMMTAVLDKSRQLYRNEIGLNHHVDALHLILQENHADDALVEICCCTLKDFLPQDFLLNYIQIAKQLMRVLVANGTNLNRQRNVLRILNYLALSLDQNKKHLIGSIGIIEIILDLIRRKFAEGTCDIVVQWCWGVLCRMTNETPSNCERFLKAEGMQLFSQSTIPQLPLVLDMVVLVRNVAEVKCLRSQLMDNDYVNIFWRFLHDNSTNGFELSYNTAYILAHLFGEGEAAWQSVRISRRDVMDEMVVVIGTWDLSTKIWPQYSSLKPILQLLSMFGSPATQHWAVWTLANLTSTDPEKYCRYVDEEGGEKLVQKLVYDTRVSLKISMLARVVLTNMETWRNGGAITTSAI